MSFTTVVQIVPKSHPVKNRLALFVGVVVALPLVLTPGSWESRGAETNPPPPVSSHLEDTNSQALLQVSLQLQEQIRATQLAIEQNRQEAKQAAAQNADALSRGLQTIQEAFSAQRAQDLAAMQRSNKIMLIVAGTFAAMGLLTMLIMTCFQWRMTQGLARISAALPTALGLGPDSAAAALALANQPDLPLFGALEAAEERARELEQSLHPAPSRREGIKVSVENRLFHEPGALVRRRRFRTVSMAVIVGLVCAAGLALVLYVVAYGKLGFG